MLLGLTLVFAVAFAESCQPSIAGCSTCTTPPGGEQTCTGCTTGGQKVQPNGKGCIDTCPANSSDKSGVCKCLDTHEPSKDGLTCVPKTACNPPIAGCSTCTTPPGGEQTCTGCTTGGQKVQPNGKGCIARCPENAREDGVLCKCVEGYAPSADGLSCASSSTNKSGLSTGAIAGISVAAVVVVGGLVGFLCWWFLCRGKA